METIRKITKWYLFVFALLAITIPSLAQETSKARLAELQAKRNTLLADQESIQGRMNFWKAQAKRSRSKSVV